MYIIASIHMYTYTHHDLGVCIYIAPKPFTSSAMNSIKPHSKVLVSIITSARKVSEARQLQE